jgi:hypothetical protein
MTANLISEENSLLEAAVSQLRSTLPASWKVEVGNRAVAGQDPTRPPTQIDALLEIQGPQGQGGVSLMVEAKRVLTPRDAERLFSGTARRYRQLNPNTPVLVVAPWLSTRTRNVLAADDINYLDLTGNVRISLQYPPLFIISKGASRDPAPMDRGKARVRGPKAGRLVRFLLDVAPPYNVSQIAAATQLAPGYTSRLLDALDSEALIERERRGQVGSVDVPGLTRRWADGYDVLKTNVASTFVAPNGPKSILEQFAQSSISPAVAVTGSFAAVRLAPVAGPALLIAYCADVESVAMQLGLLPADRGANVVLLRPYDPVIWERTTTDDGVTYVAAAQLAIDCLAGNGRMPSEGEALLSWMEEDESRWRVPSLETLDRAERDL